ncbi:TIGR03773 family transporter-associated surface protein [Pauljensenia sp. UMB0018B]|uniref:Cobalt ABC transporter permease n=1 Tax=Schaalia odontolytica TaxID=1660 RepID=A0A2I1HYC9_9ACTO|nr:TIGR03773 family transporter-associated surface protein [Schaalia odontolytica]MDK7339896.1 TIGR03773 family transporter-associated surface protein [Pauljensenia sp. UMB0018B]PKY63881.1 cobalt ABC transporter permease [Schaalia odontolytica]
MNPTKYRNPGRAAARAFAAMALAATSFLVPGAAHAADEATADTADAVTTEEATTAEADTANAATASSEADATACAVMRTAPAGTTATLDRGHADIFDLTSDASGNLTLRIKEDATGSGVMREPEQTLLAVNKSTLTQIPGSVSQATGAPATAYLLGQSGDNQATVLWPGWDTLGITAGGYNAARFHISYTGPENGRIYAFTSSFTEGTKAVTNDGSFDLAPEGDDIDQPYAAHKHVNWLFTRAGRYTLTVQASAWTPGNTGAANAQSAAHTYTIDVADEASCLAESGSAPSTDQAQPAPAPGVGPGSVSSTNNQPAQDQADNGTTGAPSAPAPAPSSGTTGTTGTTTGANPAPASGTHTTSGTTGGERCVATRITREATEAEAATLASNSAPANTARTTLTVSVGDGASGNATDGHFDLGPAIENGTLVARVKDDRSQPAQWVDPSSLTFALGDAARITAPADLGFVATPGSSVWLIPSTQIAGVPWLGLNSQREEIVTGTTGPVQFTLDAVEGPGRVAVFNAGALGSGVGEHVFDGPGTGYTLGANTHAHQNWVFTAPGTYTLTITMRVTPNGAALAGSGFGSGGDLTATGATGPSGRPMVSQVVGRTASGKECDLSLATTGADTIPLTVVSLTWALTGAACVWVGAIGRRRNLRRAL